jgi:hypothetical protein
MPLISYQRPMANRVATVITGPLRTRLAAVVTGPLRKRARIDFVNTLVGQSAAEPCDLLVFRL